MSLFGSDQKWSLELFCRIDLFFQQVKKFWFFKTERPLTFLTLHSTVQLGTDQSDQTLHLNIFNDVINWHKMFFFFTVCIEFTHGDLWNTDNNLCRDIGDWVHDFIRLHCHIWLFVQDSTAVSTVSAVSSVGFVSSVSERGRLEALVKSH